MRALERALPPPEQLDHAQTANPLVLKPGSLEALERLLTATQSAVCAPQATDPSTALWARFACLLVGAVGFAGSDAIESLSALVVRDLLPLTARGYLHLPRLTHTIPVAVDSITRLAGLQLLGRASEPGRMGLHSRILPSLNTRIFDVLGLRDGPGLFAGWLRRSCEELDIDLIGHGWFLSLAALRAALRYSQPVAGYLTGALVHRPASLEGSVERLAALRAREFSEEGDPPARDLPWIDRASHKTVRRYESDTPFISNGIRELRRMTRDFRGRAAAELGSEARRRMRRTLKNYADKHVDESGLSAETFWDRYWHAGEDQFPCDQIERGSLALAALHLAKRTAKSGHTLKGDLAAITRLLAVFGDQRLHRIAAVQLADLHQEMSSTSARARHISAVNQLRDFLEERCPGDVRFPHVQPRRLLKGGRGEVLEPTHLARACRVLADGGDEGHAARLALLLGAFGGLRLGETLRLRLQDISWSADDEIVLFLARPKRRGHRWAHLVDLPPGVHAELRRGWEERRLTSNPDDPLLVGSDGQRVETAALGRRITAAFRAVGVRASHRAARTFWANRLFALGYSLPEIGHLAGHSSLQTTVGSYIHILPWLQQEELRAMEKDAESVRSGRLGVMLGYSNRAVRREHLEREGIPFRVRSGRRRAYAITVEDACDYLGSCFM